MDIFGFKNELSQALSETHAKKQLMNAGFNDFQTEINTTLASKTVLGSAFMAGAATTLMYGKQREENVEMDELAAAVNDEFSVDPDLTVEIEAKSGLQKKSIVDGLTDQLIMTLTSMLVAKVSDYAVSLFEPPDTSESVSEPSLQTDES